MIIPVHEVRIDEFIGAEDYAYPDPEGEFGVYVYTGHRQVSAKGQGEVLVVGVQGRRYRFEDLLPMNLIVVADTSGSMGEPDKLDWVKESLVVLLDTLRDKDYLSLVLFGGEPRILLPSTRLGESDTLRARLRDEVRGLTAKGDSNIVEALAAGFREAAVHFQPGGANRVLLLTDGWGRTKGITRLIKANRKHGVEVSVIGYGENFETNFARGIFEVSGGSSRFVSDRKRMEEIFGSGLARTAVPLARNVSIELVVDGAQAAGAWGLDPSLQSFWDRDSQRYNSRMIFTVPVIHSGDYETAVAMLQIPPAEVLGPRRLLTVHTRYTAVTGEKLELKPQEVLVDVVAAELPVAGFSDARVLKAGAMLRYAQELQRISGTYYGQPHYGGAYYGRAYSAGGYYGEAHYEDTQVYQAFFHSYQVKKELKNAAIRLGDDSFADQIEMLESYMRITGKEIGFKETIVEQIIADNELRPPVPERPLKEHMDYLFRELALDLEKKPPGNVAVSGFSLAGASGASLVEVLNEAGATFVRALTGSSHPLVERRHLDEILREQELALSDLVDPREALSVGEVLAADYLLTGTVIPMSESVVVFARILNVESAVIESVAQVIVARSPEVDSLL